MWTFRCAVSMLIRSVRSAICTSGEPVSVSWRRYSVIVAEVSGIFRFVLFRHQTAVGVRGFVVAARQGRSHAAATSETTTHPFRGAHQAPARGASGRLDVPVHGLDQGLDGVEALLGADPVHEPHRGRLAVEVAAEIEQVGLEQQIGLVGVEGRAVAEGDGGRAGDPVGAGEACRRRCRPPGGRSPPGRRRWRSGSRAPGPAGPPRRRCRGPRGPVRACRPRPGRRRRPAAGGRGSRSR